VSAEVVERTGGVEDGARVTLETRLGPLPVRWIAEHRDYQPGLQFRDVQVTGPFARWEHTHRVEAADPEGCYLKDRVEYALPLGGLGELLGGGCGPENA
jgi:ligand-binding SRPBCC domain-containing protein